MWLHFSLRSLEGDRLYHSLQSPEIEVLMETLNQFVNSGCELVSAHLVDQKESRLALPLKAFDGQPIGVQMRELEKAYQQVLSS